MIEALWQIEERMKTEYLMSVGLGIGLCAAQLAQAVAADVPSVGAKAEIIALAHKVVDAFNRGDMATVTASMASGDQSILDEMPPFSWRGPQAIDTFLGDVAKDNERMGDTDGFSVLGPPIYIRVAGNRAYAAFPDRFSYKRRGAQIREDARITFTAEKTPTGWRIVALAYTAGAHK